MADISRFGSLLKEWRGFRRFSQLDLSMEADMSARHLSFLESGRANPSRAMVIRLAQALQMPRAIANQALNAAGFTALFPEMPVAAPELTPVHDAIKMMLDAHDPFPGVAVDRHWNITAANSGAGFLTALLPQGHAPNLMDMLIISADNGLTENWEEIALLSLARLRAEQNEYGTDPKLSEMIARLAGHDRLRNVDMDSINLNQAVIPTILRLGEIRLSLFSTIAQFGTVQDVNLGELRVELMFPADNITANYFRTGMKS